MSRFIRWRCLECSWKFLFSLCILCISLNLLLLNLYPLMHPESIDCNKKYLENDFLTTVANQQNWFEVANDSYVYSAYHARCPKVFSSNGCIQFIGVTLNTGGNRGESKIYISSLKCSFRKRSMLFNEDAAFIELLPEDHFLPYTAAFFYCQLKNETFPEYATVYDEKPTKWFPVEKMTFTEHFQRPSLSLCVRPLYGHFSKLFLLQFLSYYLSKGIERFNFYHHNATRSTLEFLTYINISLTLLPWNIPLSNDEVHEFGQIAFTQDCLARSRYKFSHTILVDLDEFLVPKQHKTLVQLVTYLDASYWNAGSFVVPNVFFCEEFQTLPHSSLPAIHHHQRQKTAWAYGYRSKYIAQPHKVRYGGVHKVWSLENKYQEVNVPSSIALLHHYKPCCGIQQTWFLHLFSFNVLDDKIVADNSLNSELFNDTLNQLFLNNLFQT